MSEPGAIHPNRVCKDCGRNLGQRLIENPMSPSYGETVYVCQHCEDEAFIDSLLRSAEIVAEVLE